MEAIASRTATSAPATPAPAAHTGSAAATGYPRLVADVGGTNVRFGLIGQPGAAPAAIASLKVADHAGLGEAARAYLDGTGARPVAASFAVATPVRSDLIEMTNNGWSFSRAALQRELGLETLAILNDFEALALALPHLKPGQLRTDRQRSGGGAVMAAIGPGTGLGVGGVVRTPGGWIAIPGEGGHATLAPTNDHESALLAYVRTRLPHVSAERLLAGIGLPLLHEAVAAVAGRQAEALTAEQVIETALAGQDPLCIDTVDVFCALLGNFAGNVTLTLGARAGVFIGGGIIPRLGERFFATRFRECFEAKGRFRGYLEAVPTHVITDTLAALTGAASALDQPRFAHCE
ncbi:glucokinase [Massilia sp. LjRoot122]|uniref:glucokinase n=1 Tax=Massilia sp. LjRoot122 TaxID=3342257 RepID=UPI003ED07041